MNDNDVVKGCEDPKGIFSAFRPDGRSVHIEAHFSPAVAEDNEHPLNVFGRMSRLKVTIIDKNDAKKKYCDASVQFSKIADVIENGKYAFNKVMDVKHSAPTGNSPAYTVRMTNGPFVGQTPAEIMSNPENKDALNKHYAFLADHKDKYPKNKIQMDAIVDAAKLMSDGKLEAVSNNAPYITILEAVPLPQIYKKGVVFNESASKYVFTEREDGLCPINEIEIVCDTSKNAPYIITVTNYFAPVIKDMKDHGKLKTIKANKTDLVQHKFNLTAGEWNEFVKNEAIAEKIFIETYGVNQQKAAERWLKKNMDGVLSA